MGTMTKRMEKAFAHARELPEAEQDELADALLAQLEWGRRDTLRPDQVEEVKRRKRELDEGKGSFATDEEMEALWKECGL
jgi:hypothetical protein